MLAFIVSLFLVAPASGDRMAEEVAIHECTNDYRDVVTDDQAFAACVYTKAALFSIQ